MSPLAHNFLGEPKGFICFLFVCTFLATQLCSRLIAVSVIMNYSWKTKATLFSSGNKIQIGYLQCKCPTCCTVALAWTQNSCELFVLILKRMNFINQCNMIWGILWRTFDTRRISLPDSSDHFNTNSSFWEHFFCYCHRGIHTRYQYWIYSFAEMSTFYAWTLEVKDEALVVEHCAFLTQSLSLEIECPTELIGSGLKLKK